MHERLACRFNPCTCFARGDLSLQFASLNIIISRNTHRRIACELLKEIWFFFFFHVVVSWIDLGLESLKFRVFPFISFWEYNFIVLETTINLYTNDIQIRTKTSINNLPFTEIMCKFVITCDRKIIDKNRRIWIPETFVFILVKSWFYCLERLQKIHL